MVHATRTRDSGYMRPDIASKVAAQASRVRGSALLAQLEAMRRVDAERGGVLLRPAREAVALAAQPSEWRYGRRG
jgi:hypothetical protein